jgi:hypothetical protein
MSTLIMRPAGVLGDASDYTYSTAQGPTSGPNGVGTLRVYASVLAPSGDLGTISAVKLSASVRYSDPAGRSSGRLLKWRQTADDDTETLTPDRDFGNGSTFEVCSSEAFSLNPWTGIAWTWTDLNRLAHMGALMDYTYRVGDPAPMLLTVSDVWVTVTYAEHGTTANREETVLLGGSVPDDDLRGGPLALCACGASVAMDVVSGPAQVLVSRRTGG